MIASPIISLLGSLQLLLEGQLPDTVRLFVHHVNGAVAKDAGAALIPLRSLISPWPSVFTVGVPCCA